MKVSGQTLGVDHERWWWPICPVHNTVPITQAEVRMKRWGKKTVWIYCEGAGWHEPAR